MCSSFQDPCILFDEKTYRSLFPALNVNQINEPVAIDTYYCNSPAIDNGYKFAQVFVGTKTLVSNVYIMKSDKKIRQQFRGQHQAEGAMENLILDSAKSEISTRDKDILRSLFINDWKSEDQHKHQNFDGKRHHTIKIRTNVLPDRSSTSEFIYLLEICYVCFV